jgi:hypothetical protein
LIVQLSAVAVGMLCAAASRHMPCKLALRNHGCPVHVKGSGGLIQSLQRLVTTESAMEAVIHTCQVFMHKPAHATNDRHVASIPVRLWPAIQHKRCLSLRLPDNKNPILLPMAWTMLPLVLLYGCFYGLDYVELWSELCVCLCMPL